MALGRCSRVFSVISKFMREPMCGNSIRVDDRGTTTSDHGPYTTLSVEDGEFERSASGTVEFLDVGFFFGQITTEGGRPDLE